MSQHRADNRGTSDPYDNERNDAYGKFSFGLVVGR
jgi:hypothetical protein